MARILHITGKSEERDANTLTFKDCQRIVGGFVEVFHINDKQVLLVNEDGISMGLTLNRLASEISGVRILGEAVLLVGKKEIKKVLGG